MNEEEAKIRVISKLADLTVKHTHLITNLIAKLMEMEKRMKILEGKYESRRV